MGFGWVCVGVLQPLAGKMGPEVPSLWNPYATFTLSGGLVVQGLGVLGFRDLGGVPGLGFGG